MNSNPYVTKVELGVELDKQNQRIDLKVNNLELGVNGSIDTTTDTTSLPDGVYRTQIPGTYTNAGNIVVKEGYYTLLRKEGGVWKLESEVKMPMQDLTPLENRITENENKVDDFIDNFSVTTDTEFNAESNNPIANSTVTPLAESLSGFTQGKTTVFSMTGAEVGLRDDLKNFESNKAYRTKVFDLPTGNNFLNFRGYKPSVLQSKLNNYSCVFVELDNGNIQKIIPATFNSDNGEFIELKNLKLPNNAVKMYVNVMWFGTSINYPTLIEISNGEISNVKEYVDSKTHSLDVLNGEKVIPIIYTNVGIYDSNGIFFAITGFRSTTIPITSNSKSFRFKGNQAAIGANWASGVEGFICIAFKMNDNTFDIVLHPIVSQTIMIDKTFAIPQGAKEIYLSWQNLADSGGNAILPELFFIDEPLTLEEYFSSINSRVPKSDKYDLSWRNFLGVNKINISESFVTGTQQERIQ